jgi:hypothetical protein
MVATPPQLDFLRWQFLLWPSKLKKYTLGRGKKRERETGGNGELESSRVRGMDKDAATVVQAMATLSDQLAANRAAWQHLARQLQLDVPDEIAQRIALSARPEDMAPVRTMRQRVTEAAAADATGEAGTTDGDQAVADGAGATNNAFTTDFRDWHFFSDDEESSNGGGGGREKEKEKEKAKTRRKVEEEEEEEEDGDDVDKEDGGAASDEETRLRGRRRRRTEPVDAVASDATSSLDD